MCCGVLQCVAVCCSVLQCVALCLLDIAGSLRTMNCGNAAVCCSVLQCGAVCCGVYTRHGGFTENDKLRNGHKSPVFFQKSPIFS